MSGLKCEVEVRVQWRLPQRGDLTSHRRRLVARCCWLRRTRTPQDCPGLAAMIPG